MIDVKPPEKEQNELKIEFTEEQKRAFEEFIKRKDALVFNTSPSKVPINDTSISKELHELNKTLKEILREMRKRKV